MKHYPIRTTRNKWNIKIYCYHECSRGCETLLTDRGDFLDVSINPLYNIENNLCNLSRRQETSSIQLYSFDRNNPRCENGALVEPDEVVIPDKSFTLNIDFPLSYALTIEIHTSRLFTRRDLIYAIKTLYKFIYDEEERTATPQLFRLNKVCSNCNLDSLMNHTEDTKATDDCSICYNTLEVDSIKLRCSHIFHKACISQWIKNSPTCPFCRTNIFVCSRCDGSGTIFYYFTGVVVPIEERGDRMNRNLSNGIFGIHSYDFESLILGDMFYDRTNKLLKFSISV